MGKIRCRKIPQPMAFLLLVGLACPGSPLQADDAPDRKKSRYFTKTYTNRTELDAELRTFRRPESITPFADRGKNFVIGILETVGANREYMKGYRDGSEAARRSNLQMRWAARNFEPEGGQSAAEVMHNLSKGTAHHTVETVGARSGIYRFRNGIDFNLDLSNLPGSSEPPPAPQPYRYGLVVEDIEPGRDGLLRAAMGEFRPEDLKYAGRSRVEWAVRPIQGAAHGQDEEPMFSVQNYAVEQTPKVTPVSGAQGAQPRSVTAATIDWQENLPRPAFRGRIKPRSGDPGQVAEPGGTGLPPVVIGLEQVEGLYSVDYETEHGLKKSGVVHGLNVPLVGQMRLERKMNEKFEPSYTSLYGVQVVDSRARVNLHKFDEKDHYLGEIKVGLQDAELGFSRRKAVSEDKDPEKNRYEISYTAGF